MTSSSSAPSPPPPPRQHGVKGVYYGGDWLDLEDCDGVFTNVAQACSGRCDHLALPSSNSNKRNGASVADGASFPIPPCPRSRTRHTAAKNRKGSAAGGDVLVGNGGGAADEGGGGSGGSGGTPDSYDVVIVGAGCVGACLARELSKFSLSVLWLEAADDVSQGSSKGNSGIVHAGYDDNPQSVRARYCWKGNQMYSQLDRELRFGYQRNGSLVLAFSDSERAELNNLMKRGETNGVQKLRIVERDELLRLEPHVNPDAVAALHAPEAGNVIPYEFTIALAENAVDNGVELRLRRVVTDIAHDSASGLFTISVDHWEPAEYVRSVKSTSGTASFGVNDAIMYGMGAMVVAHYLVAKDRMTTSPTFLRDGTLHFSLLASIVIFAMLHRFLLSPTNVSKDTPLEDLVSEAGLPEGGGSGADKGKASAPVSVQEMLVGGSGSCQALKGQVVGKETVTCRFVLNCAGGAADHIARMIGDESFTIKPRIGDYILLNRNQGHLAKHTLFPCPDPVLGKGVLVQTTLWGNLILGPTARDMHKAEAKNMSPAAVQEYILGKCKQLVPSFDAKETIHSFAGARAKSDAGDWNIGPSAKNPNMIHVAGIDSPGLAGSPAIAVDVVEMLKEAGLFLKANPNFNPNRAPIITPKDGLRGLKMGAVGKFDSDGRNVTQMAQNVVCKCERVTELEVVRAMRRSLPIDSSQGIRKRTRAGMGHCQGDPDNYNCEARVRAIIARENGVPVDQVGGRPWPATSTLPRRWITDDEKQELQHRMNS